MKTLLLVCLFVIFSASCFASENSCTGCSFIGTVVDAATGRPMANVVIIARGIALSQEQKVITDDKGQYKIPQLPSGTYTLRFEKNNYKPLEKRNLSVNKNSSRLNIELLLDEERIDDYHNWLLKINFNWENRDVKRYLPNGTKLWSYEGNVELSVATGDAKIAKARPYKTSPSIAVSFRSDLCLGYKYLEYVSRTGWFSM